MLVQRIFSKQTNQFVGAKKDAFTKDDFILMKRIFDCCIVYFKMESFE